MSGIISITEHYEQLDAAVAKAFDDAAKLADVYAKNFDPPTVARGAQDAQVGLMIAEAIRAFATDRARGPPQPYASTPLPADARQTPPEAKAAVSPFTRYDLAHTGSYTEYREMRPDPFGDWVRIDTAEALLAERNTLKTSNELLRDQVEDFRADADKAEAERDAARADVARLTEAIERQKGALKMFERANKTTAMARAPAELKETAVSARRNEAGVQEANAVLTEDVERLTERNAGLAAALRETTEALNDLVVHLQAEQWKGPPLLIDTAPLRTARQALEKWGGE